MPEHLTWSLVIATYKRGHILPRCLRLAAKQTVPPSEIVVVDASPDWDQTRDLLLKEFAYDYPQIPIVYVQAVRPSLTAQRNQGIDLANSDIQFLLDDDSLMYSNCAEEILKVYEADKVGAILGVSAISVSTPPDIGEQQTTAGFSVARKPRQTKLRTAIKAFLGTQQTYFLPYDDSYPSTPIPQEMATSLSIARIQVMAGFSMTFRKIVFKSERFSEILMRYAAGEDQDFSYRVSRHGAIVNAINAKICHLEISGGRLSEFKVKALAALNPAVLQQMYSPNRAETNLRWRKIVRKRIAINFFKDFCEREWTFSRTRGVMYGYTQLRHLYTKSPEELHEWYPKLQEKLLASGH